MNETTGTTTPHVPGHPRGGPGPHSGAILKDRLRLLFTGAGLSLGLSLAVAAILVSVHFHAEPSFVEPAWLASMLVLLGLRGLLAWRYLRRSGAGIPDPQWQTLYRGGVWATGALWGLGGILFYPGAELSLQVFTLLVLAGVSAGALSAMVADGLAYRGFVLATLAPVTALALAAGEGMQLAVGMLAGLLALFLLRSGQQAADTLVRALALRHENTDLLARLEQEKARVVHEGETLLGGVLSCAPIALWTLAPDGTVGTLQGDRLARDCGISMPKPGDNLMQFFAAEPKVVEATQRALSGAKLVTEIELAGNAYEIHYSPLQDPDGTQAGVIGVAIDISERKRNERELIQRAHFDALTGLPNRALITHQIEHAIDQARRQDRCVALLFLDLDNFKAVNDTMGHAAGDALLRDAAERLRRILREADLPARLGGDEFLVVGENLQRPEDAEVVAHRVVSAFRRPFMLEGREFYISASVGVALFPQDGDSAAELLQCADTAMYQAKAQGRNGYCFFTRDMQESARRHLQIETELRQAVQRGELQLLFQPKIALPSRRIAGAEALLRWESPRLGTVSPDQFIPVAEFAGLMPQIGDWVLREACREVALWRAGGAAEVHVAINVSPQQFRSTDLLANVAQALVESGLPADAIELEITESLLLQDAPHLSDTLDNLRQLGVRLALDDFGTGYSSLAYLKRFPMQVLKIDKSFVDDIGCEEEPLVEAIIAMGRSLRMEIVAEGVENAEQLVFLSARGVSLVQGYHFSRPVPGDRFRAMLEGESVTALARAEGGSRRQDATG